LTRIFAFGEYVEGEKPPEIHQGKFLCFNSHQLFGVDGNLDHA